MFRMPKAFHVQVASPLVEETANTQTREPITHEEAMKLWKDVVVVTATGVIVVLASKYAFKAACEVIIKVL